MTGERRCAVHHTPKLVPENLRRLAKGIETYDDTLPQDLMKTAMEAAVTRLLASELRERLSK
jgi:hypothetical protein